MFTQLSYKHGMKTLIDASRNPFGTFTYKSQYLCNVLPVYLPLRQQTLRH